MNMNMTPQAFANLKLPGEKYNLEQCAYKHAISILLVWTSSMISLTIITNAKAATKDGALAAIQQSEGCKWTKEISGKEIIACILKSS